ncbi:MAG TPA: hypothetical protein VJB87_04730 [Candidatus Nanoarchaeia archaeon]|nr:hypothetical protein [Candidatus Nanoarchaeia archaeon]
MSQEKEDISVRTVSLPEHRRLRLPSIDVQAMVITAPPTRQLFLSPSQDTFVPVTVTKGGVPMHNKYCSSCLHTLPFLDLRTHLLCSRCNYKLDRPGESYSTP